MLQPLKNNHGQGIVETLIVIILFLTAGVFALVQLSIVIYNNLLVNEASFATGRVAVVCKKDEVQSKTQQAALLILGPQVSPQNLIPTKVSVWEKNPLGKAAKDYANQDILAYTTRIQFFTRLMFSSLLNPFHMFSFYSGGNPYFEQISRARMVKSPDEKYYWKAYPDAKNFNE